MRRETSYENIATVEFKENKTHTNVLENYACRIRLKGNVIFWNLIMFRNKALIHENVWNFLKIFRNFHELVFILEIYLEIYQCTSF